MKYKSLFLFEDKLGEYLYYALVEGLNSIVFCLICLSASQKNFYSREGELVNYKLK